MTRRQSNTQWSDGIAAQLSPKISECKNPLENFSPRFLWNQDGILLIDCLPKGPAINAEYYVSLLAQLKDIWKEKHSGEVTNVVLFLHDNTPTHRALANPEETGLSGFPIS
jgi:hypothetical protein